MQYRSKCQKMHIIISILQLYILHVIGSSYMSMLLPILTTEQTSRSDSHVTPPSRLKFYTHMQTQCFAIGFFLQNQRITKWPGLEGTLKNMSFQPPCHGQVHLLLGQAAQGFIQSGFGHSQGWGTHSFCGKPVPQHPHLIFNLN